MILILIPLIVTSILWTLADATLIITIGTTKDKITWRPTQASRVHLRSSPRKKRRLIILSNTPRSSRPISCPTRGGLTASHHRLKMQSFSIKSRTKTTRKFTKLKKLVPSRSIILKKGKHQLFTQWKKNNSTKKGNPN